MWATCSAAPSPDSASPSSSASTGLPVSNHENYCASGATAIRRAWVALAAGLRCRARHRRGEDDRPRRRGVRPTPATSTLPSAWSWPPGAMSARRYMHDHRVTREAIAAVAVKNHAHSVQPLAQYQRPRPGWRRSWRHAPSPARSACSTAGPISDGAGTGHVHPAGLRRLRLSSATPRILGCGLVSGGVPGRSRPLNDGTSPRRAGEATRQLTGIGPSDVDIVEMRLLHHRRDRPARRARPGAGR